jgi:hypothetical protein
MTRSCTRPRAHLWGKWRRTLRPQVRGGGRQWHTRATLHRATGTRIAACSTQARLPCCRVAEGPSSGQQGLTCVWPAPCRAACAPCRTHAAVIDGEIRNISLSDYRGKYVVLFFFPKVHSGAARRVAPSALCVHGLAPPAHALPHTRRRPTDSLPPPPPPHTHTHIHPPTHTHTHACVRACACVHQAFTFVCPTEIIAFSDRVKEFDAVDCQVIAASTDTEECHLAWIKCAAVLPACRMTRARLYTRLKPLMQLLLAAASAPRACHAQPPWCLGCVVRGQRRHKQRLPGPAAST